MIGDWQAVSSKNGYTIYSFDLGAEQGGRFRERNYLEDDKVFRLEIVKFSEVGGLEIQYTLPSGSMIRIYGTVYNCSGDDYYLFESRMELVSSGYPSTDRGHIKFVKSDGRRLFGTLIHDLKDEEPKKDDQK